MDRNQTYSSESESLGSSSKSSTLQDEDDLVDESWIRWFTSLRGNEFFCEVDEEYVEDDFNLTGLSVVVPLYRQALECILDIEAPSHQFTEQQQQLIHESAMTLYGLIHARFILTPRGMRYMEEKAIATHFGVCRRVDCESHALLPVGLSDRLRQGTVKLFCPRCQELYIPSQKRHAGLDGAYWGSTFAHFLLLTLREETKKPSWVKRNNMKKDSIHYIPRIFGFKVFSEVTSLEKPSNTRSYGIQTHEIRRMGDI